MLAIIGGTGLANLAGLQQRNAEVVSTTWGDAWVELGQIGQQPVLFLPRHGHPPRFPPHKVNYRANIQALLESGARSILAITAVGSVDADLRPGDLVLPDQIIDYTWGRAHTFFDEEIHHIDYTFPYDEVMRQQLIQAASSLLADGGNFGFRDRGVYGCTQGPRLETAAEIRRMRIDGCDIVGMTAMPEAPLARELDIPYAGLSVVVNPGAGLNGQAVDLQGIERVMQTGMAHVVDVITQLLKMVDYSA